MRPSSSSSTNLPKGSFSTFTAVTNTYLVGAGAACGGSRVCVCPSTLMTLPPGSCVQIFVPETQGSARTSSSVARFLGSISSIRDMICLLSLGSNLNSLHGPLITSGFFSAVAPFAGVSFFEVPAGTASRAGVSRSVVDFEGAGE